MLCPVCPTAGFAGGWIGSYFGINPPETTNGKILSGVLTASSVLITIIALKVIFNITFCVGGTFTLENMFRVGVPALILGIIYSIAVNCLLDRLIYHPPIPKQEEKKSCCHE